MLGRKPPPEMPRSSLSGGQLEQSRLKKELLSPRLEKPEGQHFLQVQECSADVQEEEKD